MGHLGTTSKKRLQGVDSRLIDILTQAVKGFDITVLKHGGLRTPEEQAQLVASGASRNPYSKHLHGKAVDVAPYPVKWPLYGTASFVKDIGRFYAMAAYIKAIADAMGVSVRLGADWDRDWDFTDQEFDDLGHIELLEE